MHLERVRVCGTCNNIVDALIHILQYMHMYILHVCAQWNPSIVDSLEAWYSVLSREVSSFKGVNVYSIFGTYL